MVEQAVTEPLNDTERAAIVDEISIHGARATARKYGLTRPALLSLTAGSARRGTIALFRLALANPSPANG